MANKSAAENRIYVLTGVIHLVLTFALLIFGIIKIFRFKTKYGSRIGHLLLISGIIQCIMAIIMIINQSHPSFSLQWVFEALGLFQQTSYYLILLCIAKIYNNNPSEYQTISCCKFVIKTILKFIVCLKLSQILCCVNLYVIQNIYKIHTKKST